MSDGIRTFNGLYYDLKFTTNNKSAATGKAEVYRKRGHMARVIKNPNTYGTYTYKVFVSRRKKK